MKKNVRTAGLWALLSLILAFIPGRLPGQFSEGIGVSEHYEREFRVRSGIALGGLGTGWVELRKDGQFYNWNLMNNYPLGTGEPIRTRALPRTYSDQSYLFFLVRYQVEGESPRIKLLQLNSSLNEGGLESIDYYYPWMSGVDRIDYTASFPFTRLLFTDDDMPLEIEMQAFSPFIPGDAKNSSIPGAFFDFKVKATGEKPVKVFLVASLRNLAAYDRIDKYFVSEAHSNETGKGFTMSAGGLDPDHSSAGEMSLFSLDPASSYYIGWEHKHPYYEKLLVEERFGDIDDTEGRNMEVEGQKRGRGQYGNNDQRCFSSIGFDQEMEPGDSFEHGFIFSWYFPNLYGGESVRRPDPGEKDYALDLKLTRRLGHYYNNFFRSSEEVGSYMTAARRSLKDRTLAFHQDFFESSLPPFILNQVNSQFNTFVTSSIFTRKGSFAIREGMTAAKPWGPYGTIDVSLYGSSSIVALFPEQQKSMMHAHRRIQGENGEIHHGLAPDVDLELNGTFGVFHRIDLVPNYIQLVLRDFFMTGDMAYLEQMWPSIVRGMNYILSERDKDGDRMPDMEGIMCSYDNFPMYGLASYIQSQWLAAMASVASAAPLMKDKKTQALAESIMEEGKALMDDKLWNGSYYRLSNDYLGEHGVDEGILTDQLIGQWLAHQSGLGYLLDTDHVSMALDRVMEASYIEGFGLRNCSWPEYPELYPIHETNLWVDQANTPWTGVELAFASFLLYEGKRDAAEEVIKSVDDRYRRSGLYWDHQEFGGHYYRPMSAWSILQAYLGLGIQNQRYSFDPKLEEGSYRLFFAHGNGQAHYRRSTSSIRIENRSGEMGIRELRIKDPSLSKSSSLSLNGAKIKCRKSYEDGTLSLFLAKQLMLSEGEELILSF